jgi:type I restriction enzyme M protein
VKLTSRRLKLLETALAARDEHAAPVIKKVHKPGKTAHDPLHGVYAVPMPEKAATGQLPLVSDYRTRVVIVEYEPDPELRDTEQIPLLEEGGIEAFLRREVLPYAPDAWVDEDATKIGYEVSFTRYFYKPQPMRTLEEIRADILALEQETDGLLGEILGGTP